MRFEIDPEGWGYCLFSLNISPDALRRWKVSEEYRRQIGHEGDGPLSFRDALDLAVEGSPTGANRRFAHSMHLFGVHDLLTIFSRSPEERLEHERYSVVDAVAGWAAELVRIKENP